MPTNIHVATSVVKFKLYLCRFTLTRSLCHTGYLLFASIAVNTLAYSFDISQLSLNFKRGAPKWGSKWSHTLPNPKFPMVDWGSWGGEGG